MSTRKITFSNVSTALLLLFTLAVLFSARVKSWLIMGLMALGFYNPPIPVIKPGEKLMPAPAMAVQSIDRKVTELQSLRGKVVFINFWATWCPPCLAEMPSLNSLYLKVKDNPNIVFVEVDVDNNLPKSTQFLKTNNYRFPVYGADLSTLPTEFYSGIIPTTVIINKRGLVVFHQVSKANYDDQKFIDYLKDLAKN